MSTFLSTYLPICIYILLIILLIIGIILGVRLINAMNRIDKIIDDVDHKVNSLNRFFNVIDFTTDKISFFSDKLVDILAGLIGKIGKKKPEEEKVEKE